jgi:hypothetical protein
MINVSGLTMRSGEMSILVFAAAGGVPTATVNFGGEEGAGV